MWTDWGTGAAATARLHGRRLRRETGRRLTGCGHTDRLARQRLAAFAANGAFACGGARRRLGILLLCCLAFGAAAGTAAAQSRQIQDVVIEQNRVIERFSPPVRMQRRIGLAVPLERRALVELPEARFPLRRVEIEGASYLEPEALAPLWEPLRGRPVGRAELEELVLSIERFYREADVYARALVTAWDTERGVLAIEVFEGYLEEIVIDSPIPDLRARLRPYLERLAALEPLRVSKLERTLLLIADLDSMTVEATLEQIPEQIGAGRLTLTIEPQPYGARLQLDNAGDPDMGPLQLGATATAGDLFGRFEQSALAAVVNPVAPRELLVGQLSQELPLGTHGLRFGYSLGYVRSEPGGELRDQEVTVESAMSSAWLQFPFVRRIERNLLGRLELAGERDLVRVGPTTAVDDRQRWLTLTATYDQTFETGSLLSWASFSQGLDVLGATGPDSDRASRAGVDPDFRVVAGELQLRHRLAEGWNLAGGVTGQYALTALPTPVLLSIGGPQYGRAFTGTSVSGESGAAGRLQLEHELGVSDARLDGFTAFAFLDRGFLHDGQPDGDFTSAWVGSLGAGLRYGGFLEALVATPLATSSAVEDRGTQLLFQLSHQF